MTYAIHLPQFEGPFDLLLFFIERDELDIYDIPIAQITDDFLAYMHQMDQLDIELASEFILVAATLMRIKAKMLLPRREVDAEGKEIDPREELVQKLVEYKKFKAITGELAAMEEERSLKFKRGHTQADLKEIAAAENKDAELNNLTLFNLLTAFQKVLKRYDEENLKIQHTVVRYPYTIEQRKDYLSSRLDAKKKTPFIDIFQECENRIHALFTFLALLEMIQLRTVEVQLGEGYNQFWLRLAKA
ncbi:MAG: segregation/condensation protein A [Chitinophagales bacterium]|nr:segregation/condensation protein A [Chitinophagales bacterium]